MKLDEVTKTDPQITFAGVNLSKETEDNIRQYQAALKIPNPNKDLHITLLYSRKYLPDYKALGTMDETAKPKSFQVFDHGGKRALVLKLDSSYLIDRFNTLMKEHDARYDYDQYQPHVTLSYDLEDIDEKTLPMFKYDIHMVNEYRKDFDEDHK